MNNVALFREAKGWSKAKLAREAQISESQVGRIERGETIPGIDTAQDLARALGVRVEALFPDQKAVI